MLSPATDIHARRAFDILYRRVLIVPSCGGDPSVNNPMLQDILTGCRSLPRLMTEAMHTLYQPDLFRLPQQYPWMLASIIVLLANQAFAADHMAKVTRHAGSADAHHHAVHTAIANAWAARFGWPLPADLKRLDEFDLVPLFGLSIAPQ